MTILKRRGTVRVSAALIVALCRRETLAAQTAKSDTIAKWSPKTSTATLGLTAGTFVFNGAAQGSAGFTIPGQG